jgi:hypothetical protein
MRFFSNEAKENADGREASDNENDRAENDGVAVPQQRIGSPWSDAPGNSDTVEATDRETDESLRSDDSEVRHDGDDLVRDSDAPRSDDQELDLPLDDNVDSVNRSEDGVDEAHAGSHRAGVDEVGRVDETDRVDEPGSVDDAAQVDNADRVDTADHVDTADGVDPADRVDSADRVDTADGVDTTDHVDTADRVDTADGADTADRVDSADGVDTADRVDSADRVDEAGGFDDEPGAEQRGGPTTTYGPDGTTTTVDGTVDSERRDLDEAEPVVATAPVEATSGETVDEADAEAAAPAVPVGAADAATAAKPDPSASPVGDRLFTDGDSFNDRLRDIALNFVDNPKEATQQAGALVDEAIDKVTTALKSQKDALAGEGDDTEKLRVELRGYREILKRISSL